MHESKYMKPNTKSHISFYDLFRPASLNNIVKKDQSVFHTNCGEPGAEVSNIHSSGSKPEFYITSEQCNIITNDSSCKTLAPSTSTIFYDLDDIAKRHSFHSLTALGQSGANLMKVMRANVHHNVFGAKSNAIVQECATQIHPNLLLRDSIEVTSRKVKKKISRERVLSSEIILRDNDYGVDYYTKNKSNTNQQRFWSYAKYRTEYTKPIPDEKKSKKKEKSKHSPDPCPCQLFSYACPCTGNKSLTELASKCPIISHQVTSTSNIIVDENKDVKSKNSKKKRKRDKLKDDKLTNTSIAQLAEAMVPKNEPTINILNTEDILTPPQQADNSKNNKKDSKFKSHRKSRKVLCPNCKEEVDVVISISTTEEEEYVQNENSLLYHSNEIPSTAAYTYKSSPHCHRTKPLEDDMCLHDPPCEMLPVCQILPNDNNCVYNVNQRCTKKSAAPKSPRVIRITKACRHHPPCTVVPSCQRANVLKNNCEYIPPCVHQPRCVNLPLCVPFSKYLPYDEAPTKSADNLTNSECPHIPRCKYIPVCQYDSVTNLDHPQINVISRVQNACEFLKDAPNFLINGKPTCVCNTFSPCQITATPCHICRSDKSCQFYGSNFKQNTDDNTSADNIVYIRDVGCQFRTDSPNSSVKNYSPIHSLLQSKRSSNSFEFKDIKQVNNYYTNIHTLRYEDKFTNPIPGAENSYISNSITSIDSECPSHGHRAKLHSKRNCTATDFHPQSAYVAAFSSVNTEADLKKIKKMNKLSNQVHGDYHATFSVKSQRSCIKDKYKKMFSVKRTRKSRQNNLLKCNSQRACLINNI